MTTQQSIIELLTEDQTTSSKDGVVASFAWPGLYPLYYIAKDCEAICPDCVNKNLKLIVEETLDDSGDQWQLIGREVNYEDDDLVCAHCHLRITPAYGDDENALQ